MLGAVGTLRKVRVCGVAAAALLVGVSVFGGSVYAQQEKSEGPRPRYFSLHSVDAYVELEGDFTSHTVNTRRRGRLGRFQADRRQHNREWAYEERLGLSLSGALLDPSFITYAADVSFGLTQNRFREDTDFFDRTDRDRGFLLQYDARLNFFPGKRLSGSVYGMRQDDRINRRFQPTLDQVRTGFGTSWVFSHRTIPMELSYDYLETDRTGNADRRDDEHFTESTLRYRADWSISERQQLDFAYEHANTKQEYQGLRKPFETTRDLFTIEHDLAFGTDGRHALQTVIHWQEESGDFARDFFEIGPQLTLKHSDHLQTMYKYQFNRERFEGLDVETQRLDFQLVHQMYTNLTTTVDLFGLYEDVENDINTTQYGGTVDWQYNRRNRFGQLYVNLALAYDTEQVEGDNGRRIILNEAHTFRDPLSIRLRQRNVIPLTVVVTDPARGRIFRLGADYLVYPRGPVTWISRIRTGRIADGDTVLVNYIIFTPTNGQIDTIRTDFSLEQRFSNGLTPYYRLSYRNQEDDGATGFARRADRTDHHRLGVNYEKKRYSLGAEYEIFDDTVEPFDAFHLSGLWHVTRGADTNVDASTRLSRLSFEGLDDRNVTMWDVALDHRWRLTRSLSTVNRVAFRFEDDSADGITRAWDVTTGLQYVAGDLSGEVTLEYDRLDLPHSQEENFGAYVRVRRELPHVLGRR